MDTETAIKEIKDRIELEWRHRFPADLAPDYIEALEMAIEALERQMPKKPLEQRYVNYEIENELIGHCPSCRIKWDVAFWQKYCSNCGQKLDWRKE
ncbi:MAG: hypothetical protein GX768_11200 [Chloroflexi bacterium]|nr:hypothetical protein [Chloroflexota bacterium]